jgi:hypothetical protein
MDVEGICAVEKLSRNAAEWAERIGDTCCKYSFSFALGGFPILGRIVSIEHIDISCLNHIAT